MTGTAELGGACPPLFAADAVSYGVLITIRLQNPAKLPELQLKFDDQIAGKSRLDPCRRIAPSALNHVPPL